MTSSNSDERCKYDIACEEIARNSCQACGELYCTSHYSQHQERVEKELENIRSTAESIEQKWKSFLSELSADQILNLIRPIYEFSGKLNEVEALINQFNLNNDTQPEYYIDDLKLRLEKLNTDYENLISSEQIQSSNRDSHSNDQVDPTKSTKCPVRLVIRHLRNSISRKSEDSSTVSQLLLRQVSPSVLDHEHGDHIVLNGGEEEGDDEIIVYLDSDDASKVNHKIRLNNNIVRYLRGPFKAAVRGTMHAVDLCAQGTRIDPVIINSTNKLMEKQTGIDSNPTDSIKPAFTQVTSDWKYEGKNPDEGFSSPSSWMRNPRGERILMKIEEHPLCAVNEWLAYVLGKQLRLPVNEVQISVYENQLVTLHTNVANDNEKIIPFMNLPKRLRKKLLKNYLMESMSIFDQIIQNVDRNELNILITIPKTADINHDDISQLKIYLIDHSNCFGMREIEWNQSCCSKIS